MKMFTPVQKTRNNIRGRYGSIEAFAREMGRANGVYVHQALTGIRKGPKAQAILKRLESEGLLVKDEEGQVANG